MLVEFARIRPPLIHEHYMQVIERWEKGGPEPPGLRGDMIRLKRIYEPPASEDGNAIWSNGYGPGE
jgi:hypothetical protein